MDVEGQWQIIVQDTILNISPEIALELSEKLDDALNLDYLANR